MESAWKSLPTASTLASVSTLTTSTSLFESSTCSSQTTSIQVVSFDTCPFSWSASFATFTTVARSRTTGACVCPSVRVRGAALHRESDGRTAVKERRRRRRTEKEKSKSSSSFGVSSPRFFSRDKANRRGGRREQKRGQKRRKHLSTVHMVCLKRGEARMDFQPR